MNNYKHFIAGVSNVVLGVVRIITDNDEGIKPQVASFVKLIDDVKYEDGYYHAYYDEMKAVVKSFIVYWRETMDLAVKRADYLCHKAEETVDKEVLVLHIVNTIRLWKDYEKKFYEEFLPIESEPQQKIYDDLTSKFQEHMAQLHEIKLRVEKMDRIEKVLVFAKEQYVKSVESKEKVFLYAHEYLSMLLADHLPEIRGSLKEILNQTQNNLKQLENERESNVNELLNKLYDKNKEQLMVTRRKCGSHCSFLELCNDIEKIRAEVLNSGNHDAVWKVTEKLQLFETRYAEFEHVADNLNRLKTDLEKVCREESIYESRMTTELPGSKNWCWQQMGANFTKRKEELKELLIKAAKALTTFFVVRSATEERMMYNNINNEQGPYSIDKYGHMVYHFDHGLNKYHMDCKGNYRKPDAKSVAFCDEIGRYILKNNEKIYQKDDCASLYKLGDDTLLKKISRDCGHSESTQQDCAMGNKDQTAGVILPDAQPVDIKRTLNGEVVKYLWESLGSILPDALYDVCQQQPKNPIHYLAHSLLRHKYSKTHAELLQKKKQSESYRANILKERKEKAIKESVAWKADQVKRRKPEESDDSYNRAVHDIYVATDKFIMSLDYYN
ncbi:uncharacterized protein LOC133528298 [Cydia pomonella]|uniref:uncharacterized protein LOC133528298 n=1 Tax=Cydia pomonella TaxID=82600 RepID=UPI002ADDFEBD|nr:uncharacterized protein LOC133528298 [Cydia pomonella]